VRDFPRHSDIPPPPTAALSRSVPPPPLTLPLLRICPPAQPSCLSRQTFSPPTRRHMNSPQQRSMQTQQTPCQNTILLLFGFLLLQGPAPQGHVRGRKPIRAFANLARDVAFLRSVRAPLSWLSSTVSNCFFRRFLPLLDRRPGGWRLLRPLGQFQRSRSLVDSRGLPFLTSCWALQQVLPLVFTSPFLPTCGVILSAEYHRNSPMTSEASVQRCNSPTLVSIFPSERCGGGS